MRKTNHIAMIFLVYKIGDYANFTEVNSFINENAVAQKISNNNSVIIEAILGAIVLGTSVGYITFRKCKKNHHLAQFSHATVHF